MVMNSTSTEEVSSQAVFAVLRVGVSAASASGEAASSSYAMSSRDELPSVMIFSWAVIVIWFTRR